MRFLVKCAVNAVALWAATLLIAGVRIEGEVPVGSIAHALSPTGQKIIYLLLAGAVLALVNTVVRPLVKLISLPLYLLTLGLFFIVVNGAMLELAAWLSSPLHLHLAIDSFFSAVLGGIVVGLVNWAFEVLRPE